MQYPIPSSDSKQPLPSQSGNPHFSLVTEGCQGASLTNPGGLTSIKADNPLDMKHELNPWIRKISECEIDCEKFLKTYPIMSLFVFVMAKNPVKNVWIQI